MEARIIEVSQEMGVDPNLSLAIAWCESGLDEGVKNRQGSSASGIFQFIKSTWKSTLERMKLPSNLDVFDGSSNIMAGVWLLKQKDGSMHWDASKECWSKLI